MVSIQVKHHSDNEAPYYDHNHSCPELHWIATGSCDYICGQTRYPLRAGQLLLIPPHMYHCETNSSADFTKLSIQLEIADKTEKASAFDTCFCETFLSDQVQLISAHDPRLAELLPDICSLIPSAQTDTLCTERLRMACNRFFLELFAIISGDRLKKSDPDMQNNFSRKLSVEDYMAYHYMPGESFSTLARQLHVSPRQLHRIIAQKYGTNYRNKQKELRVEIATNFLCNTDKSITKIAELMGYSDVSSFSNFMKKATGKSPQQIRKEGSSSPG